jgi:malonyl-CoA/methylmalonyl-CoA synthetase
MANPLYDTLFGAHAGRSDTFLKLADGSEWSYAAFLATAARFAHALTARPRPGDRLAAQVHKSPEALALYAACAQAGMIFLPLNTAYTVDELLLFHREQRRAHGGLRRRPRAALARSPTASARGSRR